MFPLRHESLLSKSEIMKFEDSDRGHAYCIAEVNGGHHPHATGPITESQARWIFDISSMVLGYFIGTDAEGITTSILFSQNAVRTMVNQKGYVCGPTGPQ